MRLDKSPNERLEHITALVTTILKAPSALVVLGQGDRMVLASTVGIEAEDDAWLPAFCAWALTAGNLTIEDLDKDDR